MITQKETAEALAEWLWENLSIEALIEFQRVLKEFWRGKKSLGDSGEERA